MTTLRKQVGALVRSQRKSKGLTQDQLAAQAERSPEMVNRIERGVAAPSFETLEAFSRVLRVDVRDFFGAGPYAAGTSKDDPLVRLIERISNLDQTDREWVDQLVAVALRRKVRNSP